MNKLYSCAIVLLLSSAAFAQQATKQTEPSSAKADDIYVLQSQWQTLLSDDLSGWEVFTGIPHKSVTIEGFPPSDSEKCREGKPFGLGDPLKIFTVESVDGKPVLNISGEVYAGLTSTESFRDYHLTLEYKWGEKKWPPREKALRDSGVLVHCTGKHGSFWNVWMTSLECQIQEADTADFIALAGTSAMMPCAETDPESGMPPFDPNGEPLAVGSGTGRWGSQHLEVDVEKKNEWNRIDIYALADKVRFVVNGKLLMQLDEAKVGKQNGGSPLESGKIQIQSESAEIQYRDVRIRLIAKFPEFGSN